MGDMWPTGVDHLVAAQHQLARAAPRPLWRPGGGPPVLGGCWVCFPRGVSGPGSANDPLWAAAVATVGASVIAEVLHTGRAGAPYQPGLLALRVGAVMEQVVRALPTRPDVLFVDAGGRDHPRRAGLALHLGAALDMPTVGVTHRPLLAHGDWPGEARGETSPLRAEDGAVVGCWMRTQPRVRPLAVHPGWRVDLPTAVRLVEATTRRQRTPDPLRRARQRARRARSEQPGG